MKSALWLSGSKTGGFERLSKLASLITGAEIETSGTGQEKTGDEAKSFTYVQSIIELAWRE
jgi:hypothetical protein